MRSVLNHSPPESKGIFVAKDLIQVVTSNEIAGYSITSVKGLVWKSSVRSKFIFDDLKALARIIIGGEIHEYRQLLNEGSKEVIEGIMENARAMKANAVVDFKMFSSQIMAGTVEISGYGTAVTLVKKGKH